MKQKASRKENFEKNTSVYFGMGLVVALSFLLVAFEWSTEMRRPDIFGYTSATPEVIELDLNVKVPEPPKPKIEEPQLLSPDKLIATDDPVESVKIETTEDTPERKIVINALPEPPGGNREKEVEMPLDFAEISPRYEGGQSALMKFLSESIRYPAVDIEQGIEGRVICTFIVEKDGSITDINVVRGVSPTIDKEAVRVVSAMSHWTPGYQNGKPVRVKFTLPIIFRLKK